MLVGSTLPTSMAGSVELRIATEAVVGVPIAVSVLLIPLDKQKFDISLWDYLGAVGTPSHPSCREFLLEKLYAFFAVLLNYLPK